jgi:hypothetical protein
MEQNLSWRVNTSLLYGTLQFITLLTTTRHLTAFLDESSPHLSILFQIHFDSLLSPSHVIKMSLSLRFTRQSSTSPAKAPHLSSPQSVLHAPPVILRDLITLLMFGCHAV